MSKEESMQRVAYHLQTTAIGASVAERDAFARSAYNRYYYSVFLRCRKMMGEMNTQWSSLPHASYPEVLNGQIDKFFNNELKRARKQDDVQMQKEIESTRRAVKALAKIITNANAGRVVADYQPDQPVNFTSADRFSLNSIEVTEAHAWAAQVNTLCNTVATTWKKINV
jgi:hypothetical protein